MTLAAEYLAGKTTKELAKAYGCSTPTMRNRLIKAGVKLRPPGLVSKKAGKTKGQFAAFVREVHADLVAETWPNGAKLADLVDYYGEDEATCAKAVNVLFREGRLRVL